MAIHPLFLPKLVHAVVYFSPQLLIYIYHCLALGQFLLLSILLPIWHHYGKLSFEREVQEWEQHRLENGSRPISA